MFFLYYFYRCLTDVCSVKNGLPSPMHNAFGELTSRKTRNSHSEGYFPIIRQTLFRQSLLNMKPLFQEVRQDVCPQWTDTRDHWICNLYMQLNKQRQLDANFRTPCKSRLLREYCSRNTRRQVVINHWWNKLSFLPVWLRTKTRFSFRYWKVLAEALARYWWPCGRFQDILNDRSTKLRLNTVSTGIIWLKGQLQVCAMN